MFKYFPFRKSKYPHRVIPPNFNFLSDSVKYNLIKAVDYYRHNPLWLASNHILAQYLDTLSLNPFVEGYKYYDWLLETALFKSVDFGMTSSINKGIIHNGAFYGSDPEIIIAYQGNYSTSYIESHWEDLSPVTVLRHHYKDFSFAPIDRKNTVSSPLNVIAVDVFLLAQQYQCFRKAERANGSDPVQVQKFLFRYPLANMLYSHIDHVCVNRNFHLLTNGGRNYVDTQRRGPMLSMDINDRYDSSITVAHENIMGLRGDIGKTLASISTLNHIRFDDLSMFPEMIKTRQVTWALIYSRLEMIKYGLMLSGDEGRELNSTNIANIKVKLRMLNSGNEFTQLRGVRTQVRTELDELEMMIK